MSDFTLAIIPVLANEGGYTNEPSDPGGETNFGISKRTYPEVDIKNLTVQGAMAIYKKDFWLFEGITSQEVANKLLDSYVNLRHNAIKIAQAISLVSIDGCYGPHTESAINALDPKFFLNEFRARLASYYCGLVQGNPKLAEFLPGWLRRAAQ